METAAAPTRPLFCAQPPEAPSRSRPLSGYRKPVPTLAELELRALRCDQTQGTPSAAAAQEPHRMALDLPRSIDQMMMAQPTDERVAVADAARAAPRARHGSLLPPARLPHEEVAPVPLQLAAWFWSVLERIKRLGRALMAS